MKRFEGTRQETGVVKAYHAGIVSGKGTMVIYGICAHRGTYGQFAQVRMEEVPSSLAIESLTSFFTDYTNTYHHNVDSRNRTVFRLQRKAEELYPLFDSLGVKEVFQRAWEQVKKHDVDNGLIGIWPACGVLDNWQERTMTARIPLKDLDAQIMQKVVGDILSADPLADENALINAFIEGQRGLSIGGDELALLVAGRPLSDKWQIRSAA